jgi:hypothetical protein
VIQVTILTTSDVVAPIVAAAAAFVDLPDWPSRAAFAVRVGAVVWLVTALGVYGVARYSST